VISIENIRKQYISGSIEVWALQGITFKVGEGEFVAIMGASGSGKSTLMNMLGLLDTPSSGDYILDDLLLSQLQVTEFPRIRNQKIGFVFQAFNLLPRLTALKNVELPMIYAGVKPAERRARAIQALERLGLGDRINHHPNELSGGQNQRVAIARALANNPAMILADEPTGALDSRSSLEIMDIFQSLNREGVTIVLVTHEMMVGQHAGRILHIRDGLLYQDEIILEPMNAREQILALPEEEVQA